MKERERRGSSFHLNKLFFIFLRVYGDGFFLILIFFSFLPLSLCMFVALTLFFFVFFSIAIISKRMFLFLSYFVSVYFAYSHIFWIHMKMPPDVRFNNKEHICIDMYRTNEKEPFTLTFSFSLENVLEFVEILEGSFWRAFLRLGCKFLLKFAKSS